MSCLWTSANPNKMGTSVGPRCVCGASHPPPVCVCQREREQACRGIQELRHDTVDRGDRRRRRPRDTLFFLLAQMETERTHINPRPSALAHRLRLDSDTHTHKERPNGHERRTHDRTGSAASPPPSAGLRSPASSHTYTLTRSAQGVGWNVAVERRTRYIRAGRDRPAIA